MVKSRTIVKFIAISFVLIIIFHHIFSGLNNNLKTETAIYYTATDGLNITGIIIRNETLITSDQNGVLHFMVSDGGRVSKDGVIANIYDNENSSITLTKINELNAKIADIEDILSYNDMDAINLDVINQKVEQRLNEFILASSSFNFSDVNKTANELLSSINRKHAALGYDVDFSSQLTSLKTELDRLKADLPDPKGEVLAKKSGYFVSKTDGYEQVFTGENLDTITYEFLNEAKPVKNDNNVVGKIVSDYEWYITAQVSINESLNFKEGEELTIKTAIKNCPELPVTVKKRNVSEESGNAVIVFSCNQMSSELAAMRSGPMTVIKKTYSGLKIPKKALRVIDSVRGVYVLNGMQIDFVPIEIVFKTESYIICKKETTDTNALKLYDKVVVKGKNLYDGKVVS